MGNNDTTVWLQLPIPYSQTSQQIEMSVKKSASLKMGLILNSVEYAIHRYFTLQRCRLTPMILQVANKIQNKLKAVWKISLKALIN